MNTKKYKYIVAEDEPLIRSNIIKKINALGFPLILAAEAGNGIDAIAAIDRELPHLIITDINMPMCDGLEVAKYAADHHPNIKTIILSGYRDFSFAQKALRYGVCDYMLKPVKTDELKSLIQGLLLSLDSDQEKILSLCTDPHELSQAEICRLMVQFLQKNFKSDISLSTLAENLGFSQEYLGKLFKKEIGQSPVKYLTNMRMNEAKQLLLQHNNLEVGKIGELSGYRDAFYFSRAFKNHTGMTPSEYRTAHDAVKPPEA